jgi:hypothetical protein
MNAVPDDIYTLNLASSGKLELRAKGLLAVGTPEAAFQASVLLHEAARIQRLAVDALPSCPPATRLASAAEQCWCLIQARDPIGAVNAWGEVLRSREGVDSATAKGILSRVAPRFEALRFEFAELMAASPSLFAIMQAGSLGSPAAAERKYARREIAQALTSFPGAPGLWYLQYRLEEADEAKRDAWASLSRARTLTPNNPRFVALSLVVATWALPAQEAEEYIAGIRGALDRAPAEVCLMYGLAELNLAKKGADLNSRWSRALEAVNVGLTRATRERLRKNLRAAQLLLIELLAGREPTMEIFYLAGIGDVASTAKRSANVIDLLTTRLRLSTPEIERDAA